MDFLQTYRKTDHAPDPYFFDWCGQNLPDAGSYWISDVDAVIRDRSGRMLLLEIKRHGADLRPHQNITYQIIHQALQRVHGQTVTTSAGPAVWQQRVDYRGWYILTFERTGFYDGEAYINGHLVTEEQVADLLSFRYG